MINELRRNKGFSLIELIVAIAIIGILVILASPRFMGRTKEATLGKHLYNVKALEDTMDRYVLDNSRFPRLSEEAYTSQEIEAYSNRIYSITGKKVALDPDGKYYDIDYVTLKDYIKIPDSNDRPNYILQNPVGKVFYLDGLTEIAKERADFTMTNPIINKGKTEEVKIPDEVNEVKNTGGNVISVKESNIDGVEGSTSAEDNITKAIELAKSGDGIFIQNGEYRLKSNHVYWTAPSRKYSNMIIDKRLTIVGESVEKTVLIIDDTNSSNYRDGTQHGITFNADNVVLKNMTIKINATNVNSIHSIFNIWGRWDGTSAKNVTIENVNIIVSTPVLNVFYMNDNGLHVKNMRVESNNNIRNMTYWNFGNIHFEDSKFDISNSNSYGSGGTKVTNTIFNMNSSEVFN